MKNYFDALDRLCESGQTSTSEAISALQGKFPELSANAERAGRIVTAWRAGFGRSSLRASATATPMAVEKSIPWSWDGTCPGRSLPNL